MSRVNDRRDWRIFGDYGNYLIKLVEPLYENQPIANVYIDNEVFALDSTTISLSLKLFTWIEGKQFRGAV